MYDLFPFSTRFQFLCFSSLLFTEELITQTGEIGQGDWNLSIGIFTHTASTRIPSWKQSSVNFGFSAWSEFLNSYTPWGLEDPGSIMFPHLQPHKQLDVTKKGWDKICPTYRHVLTKTYYKCFLSIWEISILSSGPLTHIMKWKANFKYDIYPTPWWQTQPSILWSSRRWQYLK